MPMETAWVFPLRPSWTLKKVCRERGPSPGNRLIRTWTVTSYTAACFLWQPHLNPPLPLLPPAPPSLHPSVRLVFSSSGGLGLFFTSSLSLSALVSKHTALSLFCVGKPVHPTYLKAHPLLFYTFAFTLPPPFPHPNVRSTLPRSGRRCSFCCSGATTKPCRNWPRHF